jgi:hypothetical protein
MRAEKALVEFTFVVGIQRVHSSPSRVPRASANLALSDEIGMFCFGGREH